MTTQSKPKTVLILGATGGVGGATAKALAKRSAFRLVALNRDPAIAAKRADLPASMEWRKGDAMNAADVLAAAQGADIILHGVNPPGYRNWGGVVLPMLMNTIAAAKASGARIVFPGTVYNFGPDTADVVDETAPQNPVTRKGRIRAEMERRLEVASHEGARTIILRAGDYFGADAPSSWMQNGMVKPGKPVRQVVYPGDHDAGHAWAYLPDLAETLARLIEREAELPAFAPFHFEGHYFERGVDFAEVIADVAGGAKITALPWAGLAAISPFNETMREVLEMRYLWRRSLKLDGTKLRAFLGQPPQTPIAAAVEDSLRALGCIKPAAIAKAA